jgi:hypothetical protein
LNSAGFRSESICLTLAFAEIQERLMAERSAAADREASALTAGAAAKAETDRVSREADQARAAARVEAERSKLLSDAQLASARADSDRADKEKALAEKRGSQERQRNRSWLYDAL